MKVINSRLIFLVKKAWLITLQQKIRKIKNSPPEADFHHHSQEADPHRWSSISCFKIKGFLYKINKNHGLFIEIRETNDSIIFRSPQVANEMGNLVLASSQKGKKHHAMCIIQTKNDLNAIVSSLKRRMPLAKAATSARRHAANFFFFPRAADKQAPPSGSSAISTKFVFCSIIVEFCGLCRWKSGIAHIAK